MKTLETIQNEIGTWASANFGQNQSHVDPDLFLGSLAPLLGMVEEVGELMEAGLAMNPADQEDALGDIGVFLCDYTSREGLILDGDTINGADGEGQSLMVIVAALCHITLKRHQGIRGMNDRTKFVERRDALVQRLLNALNNRCWTILDKSLMDVLQHTWDTVVAKRDWKAKPEDGGGHDHHDPTGQEAEGYDHHDITERDVDDYNQDHGA